MRNSRILSAFVLFALFNGETVKAETLTIERAAALAVEHHPFIQSRVAEKSAADSDLTSANNQFLPSVSVSALRGNSGASQRSATISQPLWTGGRLSGQQARAKANVTAADVGVEEAQQSILSETVGRYLELYRAQQSNDIAISNISEHQRLLDIIDRRVAANTSPQVDAMLAMARLQYAESEALQFENLAASASSALAQLIGQEFEHIAPLNFEVAIVDTLPAMRQAALDYSPSLSKLSAESEALDAEARIAKANMYPTLSLAYEKRFGDILLGQEQEQIYLALDYQPGAGFSSRANYSAAKSRQRALTESRLASERDLKVQVETTWSQFLAAQRQLAPSQTLVDATSEVVESYLRQYVVGRKSWLDVLNAQRESTQARYTLVNNQVQFLQSYYQLKILTGELRANSVELL